MSGQINGAPAEALGGGRVANVLCITIAFVAVTGYFVGITSPMKNTSQTTTRPSRAKTKLNDSVLPAQAYAEMAQSNRREQEASKLLELSRRETRVVSPTAEERLSTRSERGRWRAFAGAPPTIPHSIDQLNTDSCLKCHGKGLRTLSLRAAKMPHRAYGNCTQCHLPSRSPLTSKTGTVSNSFRGLTEKAGSRAFPGAPPMIPHGPSLRNDCLSCHGRTALPGLRTSHPQRSNCAQCHLSTSAVKQLRRKTLPH